jgi:hypothetical protein
LLVGLGLTATACSGSGSTADGNRAGSHRGALRSAHTRHLPGPPLQDADTPFDLNTPSVANLDPNLLAAVQAAARDAQDDGVPVTITSGWRSRAHQARLFAEALAKYGSEEEARRYVATPDTSAHVTGDAVDIGPTEADSWLSQHGADYGLCQTFANEIWHYELATTPGGVCPAMLADGSSR